MPWDDIILGTILVGLVWLIWRSRRSKRTVIDTTGDTPHNLNWLDRKIKGSSDDGGTGGGFD